MDYLHNTKFIYKDEVRIMTGFYRGYYGCVINYQKKNDIPIYTVRVAHDFCLDIPEYFLEKIN